MAAQLPDKILFRGEQLDLYCNPLELFWTNTKKKRPAFITSPECSRGYVASWEILDNSLLLTDIDGLFISSFLFFHKQKHYTFKNFSRKNKSKAVKATWFSGKLRVPIGKMTMYEHSGYDSRFEKELIITIHEGEVVKIVTIDFMHKSLVVNSETD